MSEWGRVERRSFIQLDATLGEPTHLCCVGSRVTDTDVAGHSAWVLPPEEATAEPERYGLKRRTGFGKM